VLTQPVTIAAQAKAQTRRLGMRPMPDLQPGAATSRSMTPYEPRP